MKKKIILSAICFALVATIVSYIFYVSSAFPMVKGTINVDLDNKTLSITTFNVRCISSADKDVRTWKNRAPLICDCLQEYAPSIICMQENKKSQYAYFKKYLKGYGSVATCRDKTFNTECLPIFFRNDLYALEQTQTFWLSDTPDVMSNTWDLAYNRICTLVVLKQKQSGKKFLVANVHLDYKSQDAQEKSINLISERLSAFDLPTVVMGDFNCTPDSKAIKVAKQKFVDVGEGFADQNKGTVNYFNDDYPNKKIDFMLQTKDSFSVTKYNVSHKKYNGNFASDHFPIFAELSFKD